MIVDTSALLSLVEGEPAYAEQVAAILASDRRPVMAAPAAAETLIVLTARHGRVARTVFDRLRYEIDLLIEPFTGAHAIAAQRAYLRYGKGRHRAALNFGDCLTYAAAELAHEPLLAIGNDFAKTDLQFARGGIVGYWPTPTAG